MSDDAVEPSVWDPRSAVRVRLGVEVALELVTKLEIEVGAYEMEPPIGSYDKTSVGSAETDVEVLEVVGMLKENRG